LKAFDFDRALRSLRASAGGGAYRRLVNVQRLERMPKSVPEIGRPVLDSIETAANAAKLSSKVIDFVLGAP
jgi:hypothetical protein